MSPALTTNEQCTVMGYQAGTFCTGTNNCIFGASAGASITTGTGNIVIGQGVSGKCRISHIRGVTTTGDTVVVSY